MFIQQTSINLIIQLLPRRVIDIFHKTIYSVKILDQSENRIPYHIYKRRTEDMIVWWVFPIGSFLMRDNTSGPSGSYHFTCPCLHSYNFSGNQIVWLEIFGTCCQRRPHRCHRIPRGRTPAELYDSSACWSQFPLKLSSHNQLLETNTREINLIDGTKNKVERCNSSLVMHLQM